MDKVIRETGRGGERRREKEREREVGESERWRERVNGEGEGERERRRRRGREREMALFIALQWDSNLVLASKYCPVISNPASIQKTHAANSCQSFWPPFLNCYKLPTSWEPELQQTGLTSKDGKRRWAALLSRSVLCLLPSGARFLLGLPVNYLL